MLLGVKFAHLGYKHIIVLRTPEAMLRTLNSTVQHRGWGLPSDAMKEPETEYPN